MTDLLALIPTDADVLWLSLLILPWLAGAVLIVVAAAAGALSLARWCWRTATGRHPAPAPDGDEEYEQLPLRPARRLRP